jgi:hypothetical protein
METEHMHNTVICARSSPQSEKVLNEMAGSWHLRGGKSVKDALAQPDEETVLMITYCIRPDQVHCLTTRGIFDPSCYSTHERHGTESALNSLSATQAFFNWVASHSTNEGISWTAIYYIVVNADSDLPFGDYIYRFFWSRHPGGTGRALGLGFRDKSRFTATPQQRASFIQDVVKELGLGQYIDVQVENDKFTLGARGPWHVSPLPTDFPPDRNPSDIKIFPFDDAHELQESAKKLLRKDAGQVVSTSFNVEARMPVHNRLCETIPPEYRGFEMSAFGVPSEPLQAWFAGDLNARPPGRIPIGRGWEGDPNLGFAYSVSVVETPHGPCIELGSDNTTHERLQTLSKYFEGLEFFPL